MDIELAPASCLQFRKDILKVRARHDGPDQDFVTRVLKVSLNTYKKCIAPGEAPLRLKRQTLTIICRNAGLQPTDYDLPIALPRTAGPQGGYTREDFGFVAGRYVQYRRSLLTGMTVNRSLLTIDWSDTRGSLVFTEKLSSRSDRGVQQSITYQGDVYIHPERVLMSLLSIRDGEVRLSLVHTPSRKASPGDPNLGKLRGVQLTHAFPRGTFQPAVTPLYAEEIRGRAPAPPLGTLQPDDPDHRRAMDELRRVEQDSIVLTPLLARQDGMLHEVVPFPSAHAAGSDDVLGLALR